MSKKIFALLLVFMMAVTMFAGCQSEKNNTTSDKSENTKTEDPVEIAGEKNAGAKDTDTKDSGTKEPQVDLSNNPAASREDANDTIVIGVTECSGTFAPIYYSSTYDGFVVRLIYQGLLQIDRDGVLQPALAESYDISEDKKTYTFHIREDAVFSDGKPVTAHDVEFTYLLVADPSYDGRYGKIVQDLVGYEEYSAKGSTLEKLEGIKVIDEKTISFTFKEPQRVNINNFDVVNMAIMPKHYYNFQKGNLQDIKDKMDKPIGSGPYILDHFEPKQFVKLKKNPKYVGEGYAIENVVFKFVELTTDIDELIAGSVDFLPGIIEPEKLEAADEAGFIYKDQYPRSGFGYLKFNCQSPRVGDKAVRKAIQYAYDGVGYCDLQFKGLAQVQYVPMAQTSWGYTEKLQNEMEKYEYDPEKAKKILDEAGWVDSNGDGIRDKEGVELVLNIPAMPEHTILDTLIPLLQENLKAVGIGTNVSFMDFNSILNMLFKESRDTWTWDLFFLAVSWTSADPDELYMEWHSKYDKDGGDNTSRFRNQRVDELLDQGRIEFDVQKAIPMYEEIGKILNDESPIIVVYANLYTDLINNRIRNMDTHSLYQVERALKDATIVKN